MAKAASLQDANFSQKGELTAEEIFKEPTRESFSAGYVEPEKPVGTGRVIYKLQNSKRNGRYWHPGEADLYNPETKNIERARLIRGVPTIWANEQKHLDPKFIAKNIRSLCFEDRSCILHESDKTAIQYMDLGNGYLDNRNRSSGAKQEYYKWDPARMEREALEKEIFENEVVALAMSQPYDKVKKHASFLGNVKFTDEMGEPRSEQGVRTLYIREAKRNPQRFKDTIDSKDVEIAYLIRRAIIGNLIDIGGHGGGIKWANGGHICKLPQGRQAQEYLLEFAQLPTEEGKQFLEHLQKKVV